MYLNKNIYSFVQIIVVIFIIIIFPACKESPGEFNLGEQFVGSQVSMNLIDTFSVDLSTVILDDMSTSGTGSILIGCFRDTVFGKIKSNSFLQIGIPEYYEIETEDTYDSLVLILCYNNYYFGDTVKYQGIFVHQLVENIKLGDDGGISSQIAFNYNYAPIGSITYTPKPNSTDTLFIRIDDIVGIDLFTKLKNKLEPILNNESFINYFHGLALIADSTKEGAIIGFNTNVGLILFTSRKRDEITESISYLFPLLDTTRQFNNITHDFSSTPLNLLANQRNALQSNLSRNVSYIQGGIGLAIRVDFPSLSDFLLMVKRGFIISKAQLFIYPKENSYRDFDLPPNLDIYGVNESNKITSSWAYASSVLTEDKLYQQETNYSFDISEYIKNELSDYYVNPGNGLLITLSSNYMKTTFYRAIMDARNRKPKLKIYYLSY